MWDLQQQTLHPTISMNQFLHQPVAQGWIPRERALQQAQVTEDGPTTTGSTMHAANEQTPGTVPKSAQQTKVGHKAPTTQQE